MTARSARWIWLDHVRDRVRDGTIDNQAGHIALLLGVHYTNERCEAWPSQRELAAAAGTARNTVAQALHNLEQHGLLEIKPGHPARTRGSVYKLRNGSATEPLETVLMAQPLSHSGPTRNSVTDKASRASKVTPSPSSNAGVLALTCSGSATEPLAI